MPQGHVESFKDSILCVRTVLLLFVFGLVGKIAEEVEYLAFLLTVELSLSIGDKLNLNFRLDSITSSKLYWKLVMIIQVSPFSMTQI